MQSIMSPPDLKRPPTRNGSGSRPPTSRFQEGSMNDRTSAAPPAQFLGPEDLKKYEDQFHTDGQQLQPQPQQHQAPYNRPFSAAAHVGATTSHRRAPSPDEQVDNTNKIAQKKNSGFFGRVRDALFSRPAQAQKQEEIHRKHSSLQEPLHQHVNFNNAPPRPSYLMHAGRANSEVHIPLARPSASSPRNPSSSMAAASAANAGDRPSREEMLASYNELMATGFFQSHAIQSTRHAPPGGLHTTDATSGSAQLPFLPPKRVSSVSVIPALSAPPRVSTSSVRPSPLQLNSVQVPPPQVPIAAEATPRASTSSTSTARPSLNIQHPRGRSSREFARSTLANVASIPELRARDSWAALRGRKRARGGEDENNSGLTTPSDEVSHQQQQGQKEKDSAATYFSQPLKRVAKKLRKMPSSTSAALDNSSNNTAGAPVSAPIPAPASMAPTTVAPPRLSAQHDRATQYGRDTGRPVGPPEDGLLRLVPSFSSGGTLHHDNRAVRLRSPEPATEAMRVSNSSDRHQIPPVAINNAVVHNSAGKHSSDGSSGANNTTTIQQSRPRRTFSGSLTGSLRGRGRNLLSKRPPATQVQDPLTDQRLSGNRHASGYKERISLEDPQSRSYPQTMLRPPPQPTTRTSSDSLYQQQQPTIMMNENRHRQQRQQERTMRQAAQAQAQAHSSRNSVPKTHPPTVATAVPLKVIPDANRGIPSVPLIPQRWHGEGKAYHLRDRGQISPQAKVVVAQSTFNQVQGQQRIKIHRRPVGTGSGMGSKTDLDLAGKENGGFEDVGVDGDGDLAMGGMESNNEREDSRWRIGSAV
ncbi:hypothetical protein F5Y16DRAFT_257748 [Xylariaceae sp. FL0255]|nr:hypothetical protein F5Y16DRAFT_257748 [Xylariaceae sp. FL0255]